MAENLQNNDFSNLVVARPIRSGMHMMGIADGEIQIGEMVTFENDQNGCPRVRRLTFEEVQLITNGEINSNNTINRVENIAQACRYANVGDAIEFIIDTCCDHIIIHDINALPMPEFHMNPGPTKKHKLDEDYPHECYKCHKKLKYLEAWHEIKKTKMTEEKFQHLWELEQIEFYCCSCYDKAVRKENPSTYSISTPFRNSSFYWAAERFFFSNSEGRQWSGPLGPGVLPLPDPSPIYTNILHSLARFAEIQFEINPVITRDWVAYNAQDEIPTFIEHRFELNVHGSGPHIHRRINMVVSSRNHSRFDGIPSYIDLTIQSDNITTVAVANLVAELVFHWASARVLFKREDEEWLDLNGTQRQDEIIPFLNDFILRQNRLDLVGEPANERFYALYPKFPHIFHLDDEHRQRCKLCGLTYLDLEMVSESEVRGPRAGHIIADGWHREYELSMLELDEHEHEFNMHGVCIHCNRTAVDLDRSRISGAEQNELSYREWLNHYLQGPHEHYYGPTGEESTCRYCGDVRNAIQRTNTLSEL